MSFAEINLFGVYVAPMSVMMVAAWLVTIALRRVGVRFDLLRYVWHPALFVFALYMIVLSSIVLVVATRSRCPMSRPDRGARRRRRISQWSGPRHRHQCCVPHADAGFVFFRC
jgi:hypothetical protein